MNSDEMKLSVIVPVYNEKRTIQVILEKVRDVSINKEIIVVDGNSIDGTKELLKQEESHPDTRVIYQMEKLGRGYAIKEGLAQATGDIIIFQDADLELDPADYPDLLKPIMDGKAIVVFGSRFLKSRPPMGIMNYLGNKALTGMVNLLYRSRLTDVETCYQVFRREALDNLTINGNDFNFTVELTVKLLRKGYNISEIPITYYPRGRADGKKVRWSDGVESLIIILKYIFWRPGK
jgi:glycosyltransferase involved in cell wall biosynthesis